jgi:hypothetical protein
MAGTSGECLRRLSREDSDETASSEVLAGGWSSWRVLSWMRTGLSARRDASCSSLSEMMERKVEAFACGGLGLGGVVS